MGTGQTVLCLDAHPTRRTRPIHMSSRPNLTREDWIHAAQRVLVKGGVDAVRADPLAMVLANTGG